jgi:hypothetical protein
MMIRVKSAAGHLLMGCLLSAGILGCSGESSTGESDAPISGSSPSGIVALAGFDSEVLEGAAVQLNGLGSRAADAPLIYEWTQLDGPRVLFNNPSSPNPLFTAPLAPAVLRFQLRVSQGDESATDEVSVHVVQTVEFKPMIVSSSGDLVTSAGQSKSFTYSFLETEPPNLNWEISTNCATELNLDTTTQEVSFITPYQLPCVIYLEAVDAAGYFSNRAATVLWPDEYFLPAPTYVQSPNVVSPSESFQLSIPSSYTGRETSMVWQQGAGNEQFRITPDGEDFVLQAPLFAGRYLLAADFQAKGASGGIHHFYITVSSGSGNHAPVIVSTPERATHLGGSFRLQADAIDIDEDDITVQFTQVLGAEAIADPTLSHVFQAPEEEGTLLFHVTASDGTVISGPKSIRVFVDPQNTNLPPVLNVPSEMYVKPQTAFTLDGAGAEDPDSGIVQNFLISQDPNDTEILLEEPVEENSVTLESGTDGSTYHFYIAFSDNLGANTSKKITVYVEEAGFFVDPARANENLANGTIANPFPDLATALPYAIRHQMSELVFTAGAHAPISAVLPDGLWLKGGYVFGSDAYSPAELTSSFVVSEEGLSVSNGGLENLHLTMASALDPLILRGTSTIANVTVEDDTNHEYPLVSIEEGANVGFDRVSVMLGDTSFDDQLVALSVKSGAFLRLTDSTVQSGSGGTQIGVACEYGILDLVGSTIDGATSATASTGIQSEHCDLQLYASTVKGGGAETMAVGIWASQSTIYLDNLSHVVGATTSAETAIGIDAENVGEAVVIAGTVEASTMLTNPEHATAIRLTGGPLETNGAALMAAGSQTSIGVDLIGGDLVSSTSSFIINGTGVCDGIRLQGVQSLFLSDSSLDLSGNEVTGINGGSEEEILFPQILNVQINVDSSATGSGIVLNTGMDTQISDTFISIESGASLDLNSRGVSIGSGTFVDSGVNINSTGDAFGIRVATHSSLTELIRSRLEVVSELGAAVGVLGAGSIEMSSSVIQVNGLEDSVGIESRAGFTGKHLTLVSSDTGLAVNTEQDSILLANSVIDSPVAIDQFISPDGFLVAGNAYDSVTLLTSAAGQIEANMVALTAWDCDLCILFTAETTLDDDGNLLPDANPLIDAAHATYMTDLDIHKDARPAGDGPDIGADEWVSTQTP